MLGDPPWRPGFDGPPGPPTPPPPPFLVPSGCRPGQKPPNQIEEKIPPVRQHGLVAQCCSEGRRDRARGCQKSTGEASGTVPLLLVSTILLNTSPCSSSFVSVPARCHWSAPTATWMRLRPARGPVPTQPKYTAGQMRRSCSWASPVPHSSGPPARHRQCPRSDGKSAGMSGSHVPELNSTGAAGRRHCRKGGPRFICGQRDQILLLGPGLPGRMHPARKVTCLRGAFGMRS